MIFQSLLLIAIAVVTADAVPSPCPLKQGEPLYKCDNTGIIVIDTTTDLSRARINEVFNFLYDLVPNVSFETSQLISFMTYGTGTTYTNPMSAYPTGACIELSSLQQASEKEGQDVVSLAVALQSLQANYATYLQGYNVRIIIFTGDTDKSDISAATAVAKQTIPHAEYTVVNLNNGDFSGFPGTVFNTAGPINSYPGLKRCILGNLCHQQTYGIEQEVGFLDYGGSPTCDINSIPTTTARTYVNRGPPMPFSKATTKQGLDELLDHVKADMSFFTIRKAPTTDPLQHTRIGIIQYDSTVSVYAPLGSLDNDGLNAIDELPFRDDPNPNTNLEGAIKAALTEKVIVLLTTTYKPGQFLDPQEAANSFKEDNGVLVVYEYIEKHGAVAPELYNISSVGYFTTSDNDINADFIKTSLCQANCFCPTNYNSFQDYADGSPALGCYYASYTQTNWQLANNKCKAFNNGFLAVDESPEKLQFLRQQFDRPVPFWLGLSYNNGWIDTDGIPLTNEYQNWGAGEPKYQTCAYVPPTPGFDLKWAAANDCRNSCYYVCEAAPCDSTRYCTDQA
ncbi:unnamed protein product [Caenorhabditis auriculariae]|uniref:C-type lectin domain-containing protein n=1 Tax=Caenorhabditis auriculariae TaxID=2777116 RepID=A0A8S1HNC2_9PELO|nr:unnamed protein product [Caenorhabditis auriculariae]